MIDPVISYVITVYNKEPYVGDTATSLLRQEGGIPSEYIFVDDMSADRSLDAIAEATGGCPNVTIVRNGQNAGPSMRVNQGARLARGKYLQFIDSDDVLAANASALMLSLMERHDADVIYGRWEKTGMESASLLGRRVPDDSPYQVSGTPLSFVLERSICRMVQMARRETFVGSGGCDERIFIQDESLALRLARVARRFILLDAPVVLVPRVEGELSSNVSQLNHDRFLANLNLLLDFPEIDAADRRRLYRRCVSAFWKQHRFMKGGWRAAYSPVFLRYLRSKLARVEPDRGEMQEMGRFFSMLEGIRRVPAP